MEVINVSSKKLGSLRKLILPSEVSSECQLFHYNYRGDEKIIKRLNCSEGIRFANKLYTLEALNINREYLTNNFVVPEFLLSVHKRIEGFAIKYVEGTNLSKVLNDPRISIGEKKYYLKRVGQILEQMKQIRNYTPLTDFYIGDLHEDNFVINTSQKEVYVVDLDSCKISGNKVSPAKYLSPMALLNSTKGKYKLSEGGQDYMVDENTDIYCYIIMILNYLYNGRINNVELTEFYQFLNFLSDIGVDKELIDCFMRIISNRQNINPVDYIETLTPKQISLARKLYPKRK